MQRLRFRFTFLVTPPNQRLLVLNICSKLVKWPISTKVTTVIDRTYLASAINTKAMRVILPVLILVEQLGHFLTEEGVGGRDEEP